MTPNRDRLLSDQERAHPVGTGLSSLRDEAAAASSPKASIPCAEGNQSFAPEIRQETDDLGEMEIDQFAGKNELECDLILAQMGDYPGAIGCKRIAAAYHELHYALEEAVYAVRNSTGVSAWRRLHSTRGFDHEDFCVWAEHWEAMHPVVARMAARDDAATIARAQAIEARRAATTSGAVHESAVAESDAPLHARALADAPDTNSVGEE